MTSYTTYVIDDASTTYANAYFELNYINVFSTSNSSSSTATTGTGGGSTSSATTTVSTGPGSSTTPVRAGNGATSRYDLSNFGGVLVGMAGLIGLGLVL